MAKGSGFIILRNVPKEEARLDLAFYQIQGGFRGFQLVPAGVHYVSVLFEGEHKGFWCYLQPNEALVKVFNHTEQQFEDDQPETTVNYQQLALDGEMNQVLVPYSFDSWSKWEKLTNHLTNTRFPPTLYANESSHPQEKSCFEQAFIGIHQGDSEAFLAELQFAFVRWLIDGADMQAFNRWRHQLQALYNAGEAGISKAPELFPHLIDTLITQFECLPNNMFALNSFVVSQASYLAEDMIDSDIEVVVSKGQEFEAYLEKRRIHTE